MVTPVQREHKALTPLLDAVMDAVLCAPLNRKDKAELAMKVAVYFCAMASAAMEESGTLPKGATGGDYLRAALHHISHGMDEEAQH